jgi:hypothetical protein
VRPASISVDGDARWRLSERRNRSRHLAGRARPRRLTSASRRLDALRRESRCCRSPSSVDYNHLMNLVIDIPARMPAVLGRLRATPSRAQIRRYAECFIARRHRVARCRLSVMARRHVYIVRGENARPRLFRQRRVTSYERSRYLDLGQTTARIFRQHCMSSSAKIMSASGIRPQRRICSRRAPSHVVRLQSMPSVCESSVRIVVFPGPKLLDVRPILLLIGFLFQRSIVRCADDTPVAPV